MVSLSAIALGRVAPKGDDEAVNALFAVAQRNQGKDFEVTIRHSLLSAWTGLPEMPNFRPFPSPRKSNSDFCAFCSNAAGQFRTCRVPCGRKPSSNEALLAIYDTDALDGPAGQTLIAVDPKGLPFYHRARLVGACFRTGNIESAVKLTEYVYDVALEKETESLL